MKPYIFLTENTLNYTQDENALEINVKDLAVSVPYTKIVYFTDRYGNIVNRTIDTLILKDTNIQDISIETSNGGTYTTFLTLTGNTHSTVVLKSANHVTTSSIRITIPDSANNPENVVAKMGVYGFLCNLLALTDSNYKIEANEGGYRVVSGAYIHYADYKKWVGKVKMENLPKTQFDLLTEQADKGEMTVIPYEDLQADEIYECAVKREYQYEVNRKTELYSLELEFNEL